MYVHEVDLNLKIKNSKILKFSNIKFLTFLSGLFHFSKKW